ncbi:MAG: hypothetical protein JSV86_08250 [Gemmatimonadota bacterium]|nr:MAG: hypothetical protein JSV86_08250 [Gemmatimonadota bacterium]
MGPALLVVGSVLALLGLALVVANSSNTPPAFVLLIVVGFMLGLAGLVSTAFSIGRAKQRGPASPGHGEGLQGHSDWELERRGVRALSALTVVLAAVFLLILGLVVGFFYLMHRWFADWNLW